MVLFAWDKLQVCLYALHVVAEFQLWNKLQYLPFTNRIQWKDINSLTWQTFDQYGMNTNRANRSSVIVSDIENENKEII